MAYRFIAPEAIKLANQHALASHWDELAAGRRFPAFAEWKPDPAMHSPKQLVVWNVEGKGHAQKFRALYQGEHVAEVANSAWAGKTMDQVAPVSLRRLTLEAARECAGSGCLVYMIFSTINANDQRVDCHRLLLPFGRDDSNVEQILASLQLTIGEGRHKVLNHFTMQADVLLTGRIKSGFTAARFQPANPDKPASAKPPAAGADKRRAARRDVMRAARISFARQSMTCSVRNISATGASIEAANPAEIPDHFKIVMEMESAARQCRVVWRKKTQIGVEFS